MVATETEGALVVYKSGTEYTFGITRISGVEVDYSHGPMMRVIEYMSGLPHSLLSYEPRFVGTDLADDYPINFSRKMLLKMDEGVGESERREFGVEALKRFWTELIKLNSRLPDQDCFDLEK